MSLLLGYYNKSAEKTRDFTKGVITGLSSHPAFASLAAQIAILLGLNTVLSKSILPRKQRNSNSNKVMLVAKKDVIEQLDVVRKLADKICNGNESLEGITGFKPSKRGLTRRTHIDAPQIISVLSTGVHRQLMITLKDTIPGNRGYEVHYVLEGIDFIAGHAYVQRTTTKLLVSNFPSFQKLDIYVITLSTNGVRSLPSNRVPGVAL